MKWIGVGVAIVLLALLLSPLGLIPLQIFPGYVTAYEGAKPSFYGVYWQGQTYTGAEGEGTYWYHPSLNRFTGTSMAWDPDYETTGFPNLEGEMTSIFIPEAFPDVPGWVPREWTADIPLIQNPRHVYEWKVEDPDGTIHFYRMEEWVTKWYVALEAGYDSAEPFKNSEGDNQRLRNVEVWFRLDINEAWYFKDVEKPYFAIAKIKLERIKVNGHDLKRIDITPEAPGSVLPLYLTPFGAELAPTEKALKVYAETQTKLNPQYFRPTVYTLIRLNDFGTQAWWEFLAFKAQGDTVTFEFTVTQFVVGEWKVKDIDEVPPDYERPSKLEQVGLTLPEWLLPGLTQFFSNLQNLITLALIAIIIIVIGLAAVSRISGSGSGGDAG